MLTYDSATCFIHDEDLRVVADVHRAALGPVMAAAPELAERLRELCSLAKLAEDALGRVEANAPLADDLHAKVAECRELLLEAGAMP